MAGVSERAFSLSGIEHIEDADLPKNFAFKCHRHNTDDKEPELHSVNSIACAPTPPSTTHPQAWVRASAARRE